MSLSREGLQLPVDSGGEEGYARMGIIEKRRNALERNKGEMEAREKKMHVLDEDRAPSAKKGASL